VVRRASPDWSSTQSSTSRPRSQLFGQPFDEGPQLVSAPVHRMPMTAHPDHISPCDGLQSIHDICVDSSANVVEMDVDELSTIG
jgi:hypothetical protein